MKGLRIALLLLPLLALSVVGCHAAEPQFRALWVSSVFNLDYPSQKGLSAEQLRKEADELMELAESCGLNAIVLQVRPCADSLYPSSLFPWSEYVSGTQGVAPDGGFDPLAYFVEQCHARGLEIHAWCNPYRVTKSASQTKEEALAKLAESHPARQTPELVTLHTDGNLYFDPGLPAARDIILAGMMEIVENYEVDGLHLDDYFYPGEGFNDTATFSAHSGGYDDIGDFRRDAVTRFVAELHQSIKSIRPEVRLGISPFGIWANSSQNPLGSDTQGSQSYYDHFADSYRWVKEGLVDYIAPQLYWPTGSTEGEYATLLDWWCDTVDGTDVELYIGLGAYRLLEAEPGSPWEGTSELESQLAQLTASSNAKGFLLFRAGSVRDNPALIRVLTRLYYQDAPAGTFTLSITRPDKTVRTPLSSFYCSGTSDTASPLIVNGKWTPAQSSSGYWGILLPLENGKNTFTFQNGEQKETLIIYRMKEAVGLSSLFPSGETCMAAEDVELSCVAPAGSRVTAIVGGQAIALAPQEDGRYVASLPQGVACTERRVLYVSEKDGFVRVRFSPGELTLLPEGQSIPFTVTETASDLCLIADPSQGSGSFLHAGMSGTADAIINGFYRIPDMGYLRLEDAVTEADADFGPFSISNIIQEETEQSHNIHFICGNTPAALCKMDEEGRLIVNIRPIRLPLLFESPLFSDVQASQDGEGVQYTLTLRDGLMIDGYEIIPEQDGFTLRLKKHKIVESNLPLEGISILIDAGHGGEQTGAIGADPQHPEKEINLLTALALQSALEDAGAQVSLTRNADITLDLRSRLTTALDIEPDVFLSVHSNSAQDDVDMTALTGVGLYMQNRLPAALADCLVSELNAVGREVRIIDNSNLYLCRVHTCLSILIENEYITNPNGLEALLSESERDTFCAAVAKGLSQYFSQ